MEVRRSVRGLSLVEVVIASVILAAVVSMIFMVLERSSDTYANETAHLALDEHARDTLLQIAHDLREAGASSLATGTPPAPVVLGKVISDLRFGANSGYDLAGRKLQFNRLFRYRWVIAPDEAANGVDDNRNGFIDEGWVEKTDPAGVVSRICGDVKNGGLSFVCSDRSVTITLELEKKDSRGTVVRGKAVTTVELRNEP